VPFRNKIFRFNAKKRRNDSECLAGCGESPEEEAVHRQKCLGYFRASSDLIFG
jgi:hypothetical protein